MHTSLKSKITLVTGVSSGIGREIAQLLAERGARFVKIDRRPLMTVGLLTGCLTVALMAGGCSKPAVKDPRLQSPRLEVFKAEAAGSTRRTFTGIVEARVQSDLGFRVVGKILERSVDVGQRVQKGQPLMRLHPEDLRLPTAAEH